MLEQPEDQIITAVQQAYGLEVLRLNFLPLGADVNAAVCCLRAADGGDDRQQSFDYLASNFQPGGTVEAAYRTDSTANG